MYYHTSKLPLYFSYYGKSRVSSSQAPPLSSTPAYSKYREH